MLDWLASLPPEAFTMLVATTMIGLPALLLLAAAAAAPRRWPGS